MTKKRWMITLAIVVVLAVVGIVLRGDESSKPSFESVTVTRGDVANEVSVTGHVVPVSRIDLAFTLGGRIDEVLVQEGDHVLMGEPMVRLERGVLLSQVYEAEARLKRELALERDLLAPLRTEERAVQDTSVTAAETTMQKAELSARAALSRAFTYTDDAIEEEVDELFEGGSGASPRFGIEFTYGTTKYIISADSQTRAALSSARIDVEEALQTLRGLAYADGDVRELLPVALAAVVRIEQFLNNLAGTVNRYIPTDTGAQTVYESYQTTVASARTAVATARAELVAAGQEYEGARAAYMQALNNLDLAVAGASEGAIEAQAAAVSMAERNLEGARAQLAHATLVAPFTGTVGLLDVTQGEVVSAYQSVGSFVADGEIELEVYIPEADVASIELGDTARVTFDAFEKGDVFSATVQRMALTETIREGVPSYKTILTITGQPQKEVQIRPGMTADIDILTDARVDVLLVPTRSILQTDGRAYVRLWDGEAVVERDVLPGLKGSDGMTEITQGLSLDEEIILFLEES